MSDSIVYKKDVIDGLTKEIKDDQERIYNEFFTK